MKSIRIPSSKSDAHRAIFCAALCGAEDKVILHDTSDDIEATRRCAEALASGSGELDVGESGATLRFALPIAAALGIHSVFTIRNRLADRPLDPLIEQLELHGCEISYGNDKHELKLSGKLENGDFVLPGNISSQFVSGLLLALPMIEGKSRIIIEGTLESAPYVDMTLQTMSRFGVNIDYTIGNDKRIYNIPESCTYNCISEYEVQGDWSGAANWFAAGVLGKEPLEIKGLTFNTMQGDKEIVQILLDMGASIDIYPDEPDTTIIVEPSRTKLKGIRIDASQIPDIIPVLALIATQARGETVIYNAERLRLKESDRIASTASVLRALGAKLIDMKDGMIIKGVRKGTYENGPVNVLHGGPVSSENDHRIAMMASVASLATNGAVVLDDPNCVSKSYPSFYDELKRLEFDDNILLVDFVTRTVEG